MVHISIDPGSGVRDAGGEASAHSPEWDCSLAVSKGVYQLLKKRNDLVPSLTRWETGLKSWRERLAEVHRHRADLCLSLYIDSWKDCHYSNFTTYVSVMATGATRRLQALLHNDVASQLRLGYGVEDRGKRNDTEHREFCLPLLENSPCSAIRLEIIFHCNGRKLLLSPVFRDQLACIIAGGVLNHCYFIRT